MHQKSKNFLNNQVPLEKRYFNRKARKNQT